jgi:hypothetical protein
MKALGCSGSFCLPVCARPCDDANVRATAARAHPPLPAGCEDDADRDARRRASHAAASTSAPSPSPASTPASTPAPAAAAEAVGALSRVGGRAWRGAAQEWLGLLAGIKNCRGLFRAADVAVAVAEQVGDAEPSVQAAALKWVPPLPRPCPRPPHPGGAPPCTHPVRVRALPVHAPGGLRPCVPAWGEGLPACLAAPACQGAR